jgi:hypothetical protein
MESYHVLGVSEPNGLLGVSWDSQFKVSWSHLTILSSYIICSYGTQESYYKPRGSSWGQQKHKGPEGVEMTEKDWK